MKRLLMAVLVTAATLAAGQAPQRSTYSNLAQGATVQVPNVAGSQAVSFEYLFSATPAAVSITIQGCMRGPSPYPGAVGTCDTAADTYTGTSNSIRSPSFTKVYDTFLITVGTLTGATLTVNTTVVVSKAGTSSGGGSGTISSGTTNTLAKYTAATTLGNSNVTENNGVVTITAAGVNGQLGLSGSTSGTATFTAPAVAGTVTNGVTSSNVILGPNNTTCGNAVFADASSVSTGIAFNTNNSGTLILCGGGFAGGAVQAANGFVVPSNSGVQFSNSTSIVGTTTVDAALGRPAAGGGVCPGKDNTATCNGAWFAVTSLIATTAPTIAAGGCGGAAASIPTSNGPASFTVNVGTTPTSGGCTVTLPAATTDWNCTCTDRTTNSTSVFVCKQSNTAASTTSAVLQIFSDVAVATAPTASDILRVSCFSN